MKSRPVEVLFRVALQVFVVTLIAGALLRTFLFSSYSVTGLSMVPTVLPGDFLVALKWGLGHLRRGEIVALRCPTNREEVCLERLIGLPGDRIEMHAGALILNGEKALRAPVAGDLESESLGGQGWLIWPAVTTASGAEASDLAAIVVPPDQVFVLNDKRAATEDSRSWGPIKADLIEAKVLRIWLSLDWFDDGRLRDWPRLRTERMFRVLN